MAHDRVPPHQRSEQRIAKPGKAVPVQIIDEPAARGVRVHKAQKCD
jgi:hypothetical protein